MTTDRFVPIFGDHIDTCSRSATLRGADSSGEEASVTRTAALATNEGWLSGNLSTIIERRYVAPMTFSADSVITAIDARRPGLKLVKKHLLLFFAQGHHVAHFGVPLFGEPIIATDRGVTVRDADGAPSDQPDSEGALNTVGYVVERYSALSPADLRTLIQASRPWQAATGSTGHVALDALQDWFRRDDETNDPDDERPDRAERAAFAEIWKRHRAEQQTA